MGTCRQIIDIHVQNRLLGESINLELRGGGPCQIPLAGDFGIFEMYPLDGEKERKRVERERIGVSSVQTGHSGAANQY
jgi:hypothetical protein